MKAKSGPTQHYSNCKVCGVKIMNSAYDPPAELCIYHDPESPLYRPPPKEEEDCGCEPQEHEYDPDKCPPWCQHRPEDNDA